MTPDALRRHIGKLAKTETQAGLASRLGVAQSTISDVIMGKREPNGGLLATLGFERIVRFVRLP